MSFPITTAWLAIFLSIVMVFLILKIVKIRRNERVELDMGDNDKLRRAVRSHGNLVETAPLFLILLACLEMSGAHSIAVAVLALMFGISRIIHPIGLSGVEGTFKFRVYGMYFTISAYMLTALYLAYQLSFQTL